MSAECDVRFRLCVSDHRMPPAVSVNETMDDGSWRVRICQPCADALGLRADGDMPEDAIQKLRDARLKAMLEPGYVPVTEKGNED